MMSASYFGNSFSMYALRSADTTGAITATTGLDGTADGQYKWVSAALRLEGDKAVFDFSGSPQRAASAVPVCSSRYAGADPRGDGELI